jgi:hypothetical protein
MAKTKERKTKKAARPPAAKGVDTQEKTTKLARVIAILQQPGGATIEAIAESTGWQAHSVRGVLSGTIKKKLGHTVKSERRHNGERVYSIA